MSEFEKQFPQIEQVSIITDDYEYWQGIRFGYLAALKWAKKIIYNDAGTDDIIGYVSPIKIIEQEINDIEREQR